MTTAKRVGLLYLDRPHARGGPVRVDTWRRLLLAIGADVVEFPQPLAARNAVSPASLARLPRIAAGRLAPESILWKDPSFDARIAEANLDAIVCVTARLWDTSLPAPRIIVDFVDDLNASYRSRAGSSEHVHSALGFRLLARSAKRINGVVSRDDQVVRVTSSWSEQSTLRARWLPVVVPDKLQPADGVADHDAIFFGSLHYPPNVGALQLLHEAWPDVLGRRPGTRLLVAGASATPRVRSWAIERDWTLLENFDDLASVCARAKVAVAPLLYASGIQSKILEAAALGVPQLVLPPALQGLEPGFPAQVSSKESFAADLVALLGNRDERFRLATEAALTVDKRYRTDSWTSFVAELLETP